MSLNKLGGLQPNINIDRVGGLNSPQSRDIAKNINSEAFKEALRNTQPTAVTKSEVAQVKTAGLKFSNHALERMQTRGISYSPDDMARIESAVQKAAGKGAKDTLLLADNSALIVNVKNNTIVTVMDKNNLKDNVFTNIDSTIVL